MTDDVYWVLRLDINDGQDEAFEALTPEMVEATLKEPGAKNYEWHRNGSSVHIFERYASNADAGLHLQNFGTNFAQKFFTILTATGFDVYGPAKGPVRDGLANSGAQFFGQVGGFDR
ncbi:putative quinol monooxygenase [Primorskyibacter sp. S87]|uniref:putative quinol monooxygenase n=1 Tax=Primorskyibacter sp. S87 TaxID=3415126 RepID=UPI003C7C1484